VLDLENALSRQKEERKRAEVTEAEGKRVEERRASVDEETFSFSLCVSYLIITTTITVIMATVIPSSSSSASTTKRSDQRFLCLTFIRKRSLFGAISKEIKSKLSLQLYRSNGFG
jgi:hypothetical protein